MSFRSCSDTAFLLQRESASCAFYTKRGSTWIEESRKSQGIDSSEVADYGTAETTDSNGIDACSRAQMRLQVSAYRRCDIPSFSHSKVGLSEFARCRENQAMTTDPLRPPRSKRFLTTRAGRRSRAARARIKSGATFDPRRLPQLPEDRTSLGREYEREPPRRTPPPPRLGKSSKPVVNPKPADFNRR
jgi:hypothetical protein